MTKLVVLKLDGDLSMGVQVTLQISEEGKPSFIEMSRALPSASDLPQVYDEGRMTFTVWAERLESQKEQKLLMLESSPQKNALQRPN